MTQIEPPDAAARGDWRNTACVVLLSALAFVFVERFQLPRPFGDEDLYLELATQIADKGLTAFAYPIRTYLYPLLLSVPVRVFRDPAMVWGTAALLQYLFLVGSALWLVGESRRRLRLSPLAGDLALACVLLNPYLLFAAHRLLTDVPSASAATVGLVLVLTADWNRSLRIGLGFGLMAGATMLRPSASFFLAIAAAVFVWRLFADRPNWMPAIRAAVVSALLVGALLAPQVRMNYVHYNVVSPLIAADLYGIHSKNAIRFLRYETVVITGHAAAHFTMNPVAVEQGRSDSIYEALYEQPLAAFVALGGHAFSLLEWGRPQVYITCLDCRFGRGVSVATQALSWTLAAVGLWCTWKRRSWALWTRIVAGGAVFYLCALGTSIVEGRFGFPLLLLAVPFIATGADWMLSVPSAQRRILAVAWLLVFTVMLGLSLELDSLAATATLWL